MMAKLYTNLPAKKLLADVSFANWRFLATKALLLAFAGSTFCDFEAFPFFSTDLFFAFDF